MYHLHPVAPAFIMTRCSFACSFLLLLPPVSARRLALTERISPPPQWLMWLALAFAPPALPSTTAVTFAPRSLHMDLLHCADTEQKYEQVWRGQFLYVGPRRRQVRYPHCSAPVFIRWNSANQSLCCRSRSFLSLPNAFKTSSVLLRPSAEREWKSSAFFFFQSFPVKSPLVQILNFLTDFGSMTRGEGMRAAVVAVGGGVGGGGGATQI